MKRPIWVLALALLLFAAACGAADEPPGGSAGGEAPAGQTDNTSNPGEEAPGGQSESPGGQNLPDEETPPQEEEPAEQEPPPVEKTHYMNRNYIFKPIAPDGESKVVLLTFDDGPKEEDMIDSMLQTLEKHDAKAIFFLNGYRIEANPALVQKLHERGQIIGNHAWDHIVLTSESEQSIDRQIEDVQQAVEELTGERPQFFRPPHGAGNDYIRAKAKEEGMLYMTWSNGSRDWESGYQTPESVVEQVLDQLHPGSNILMHELPWTVEALDTLLTKLEEEGYSFLDPRAIQIDYQESETGA